MNKTAAAHFGMEVRQPLIPLPTLAQGGNIRPPFGSIGTVRCPQASFLELRPENVVLLTLKPSEAGSGLIVRVQEIGGEQTTAHLHFQGTQLGSAFLCNLLEEQTGKLSVRGDVVEIPLKPYGVATVRLYVNHHPAVELGATGGEQ
jgi:alpha-mannosidase